MTQGLWIKAAVVLAGLSTTGAVALRASAPGDQAAAQVVDPPKPAAPKPVPKPEPSISDRFAQIRAEYDAQMDKVSKAVENIEKQSEFSKVYFSMAPDDVAFARRMIELAMIKPADPGARDALVWVINHPNRGDTGAYGDEFARACALLTRHHGDDPEAVRIGLQLDNLCSIRRDALLAGFVAAAKSRESKGLARLALAQYLVVKSDYVQSARKSPNRSKMRFQVQNDDGKLEEKSIDETDEDYAYRLMLAQSDSDLTRREAIRLFHEVISDYGDVPYTTVRLRALETRLKDPNATWGGKPVSLEDRRRGERMLADKKTLGQVAEGALDKLLNITDGMPVPEIAGVGMDGKPRKLSDYRGKVVMLVFWGTWCGPCMAQVPHERELAERFKNKPFEILGVDCDDDLDAAKKVMATERITWPNWNDGAPGEGPIAKRYHIKGYPTIMLIDAKGVIQSTEMIGTALDEALDKMIAELEAAKTKP